MTKHEGYVFRHGRRIAVTTDDFGIGRKKKRQRFALMPMSWLETVLRRRAGSDVTLKVVLLLLHEYWRNGKRPIKLTNVALAKIGVNPESKRRALGRLRQMGVINVEGRKGKNPLIAFLLDPDSG
jgi:hypothetical protein